MCFGGGGGICLINTQEVGPNSGKISDVFSHQCNLKQLSVSSIQTEVCHDELALSTCGKRNEREGKCVFVKERENKGNGGRDYFRCPIDLKSALCHVEKLCYRQRCFVWVITAALLRNPPAEDTHYKLRSPAFLPLAQCFWPAHVQPLSCPLIHLHYLL